MSVNQFLDAVPFSVSGLQNLQVNTINGGGFITTINISGQTAFLSWNSTTETLTLLIPNANGSITGLLTSTDWNTFNNKENLLTFTSPLTRVGNTISFDFTQSLTFNGTTQTLNNNTIVGGGLFYTGATSATTGYILYIDNLTGYITKGLVPPSTNLLPLDNVWTGNLNRFENAFIVENKNNSTYSFLAYRNKTNFPNDFTYFNNGGKFGYYDGTDKWTIDRFGQFVGGSIIVNDFIQATNNIETTNGFLGGAGLNINPIIFGNIVRINAYNNSPDYLFYDNTNALGSQTTFGFYNGFSNSWSIESLPLFGSRLNINTIVTNTINATGTILTTGAFNGLDMTLTGNANIGRIQTTSTTVPNRFRYSHFEPSPPINPWIATTHSFDGVDKPIIGNLGLVLGGFGACFGAHNSTLGAWAPCWINPGDITYIANLVVTNSFTPPSDKRLKGDISYLDAGKSIAFIKRLKPCIYKRIDKLELPNYTHPEQKLQHGFLADDVEEVAETEAQKALVGRMKFAGFDDCKNLAILNLIPEIVQANKEMIDKIEKLETENNTLLERIDAIELKMKTLVKLLGISI